MSSLSQAPRLGDLPSPHSAFQEYATHMARWPAMLNSKGSWSTCILQGLTTFLQCAFTAHRQPAIEGPVAHPFQRMQQPQGDHLTGPEVRLRMFGNGAQLLIDLIEQRGDKLAGDHGLLRAWQGCTLSTSVEEVHDYGNRIIMPYHLLLVCKRLTPLVTIQSLSGHIWLLPMGVVQVSLCNVCILWT